MGSGDLSKAIEVAVERSCARARGSAPKAGAWRADRGVTCNNNRGATWCHNRHGWDPQHTQVHDHCWQRLSTAAQQFARTSPRPEVGRRAARIIRGMAPPHSIEHSAQRERGQCQPR